MIFENNYIYRNIFNSKGIESIETNITLEDNFIYNKDYSLIVLGKDMYDQSFNYIYYEPKNIFISKLENEKEKNSSLVLIIVICAVALVILGGIGITIYCCLKKKKKI